MPRNYGHKKKKSDFWKKAGTVANVAGKALKTALMVKSLVNVESKYIDIAPFSSAIPNTGVIYLTNALSQGITSVTRIGDSVKMHSMELRGSINQSTSATQSIVRMWIIKHKEPRGATLALATDLWENTNVNTFLQVNKRNRYTVLLDRTFHLQEGGASQALFHIKKKLGQHTIYDGNAGTVADIQKNAYYVVFLSNEPTYTPSVNMAVRLRYTDD